MVFEIHAVGRVAGAFGTSSAAPLPHIDGLVRPDGLVDYRACLGLQERLRDEAAAGTRAPTLLLVEHPPVYTAGRRADASEYPYDGTEVVAIDRGGKVTWHGPGMLIAYFIGRVRPPVDTAGLVRDLEVAIVETLAEFGVAAEAIAGRPGVWCPADARGPARKIAAIGLSVRRGVTMHGIAVNCSNDLRPFGTIVPCGISDAGVASIASEGVEGVDPVAAATTLVTALQRSVAHRFAAGEAAGLAGEVVGNAAVGTDGNGTPAPARPEASGTREKAFA